MSELAEVLAAHRGQLGLLYNPKLLCDCGVQCDDQEAWATHVAEAIAAAGLAVVENGEPYRDGEVNIRPSDGHIFGNGVSNPCDSPAEARSYAAALLAAVALLGVDEELQP